MLRTTTVSTIDTKAAARFVGNRVLGDLLSIHEKFGVRTEQELRNLAYDVTLGLLHDCLNRLSLFLYPTSWTQPHTAYVYERTAPGSFTPSSRSGRIERCSMLVGGTLDYEVSLRDRGVWDELKRQGHLKIDWKPCAGQSTAGMTNRTDGGYASGNIGFSRNHLRRQGY